MPIPARARDMLRRRYAAVQNPRVFVGGPTEPENAPLVARCGLHDDDAAAMLWDYVADNCTSSLTPSERVTFGPDARRQLGELRAIRNSPLVFPGRDGKPRDGGSCRPILRAMAACGLNSEESVSRDGTAHVRLLAHPEWG